MNIIVGTLREILCFRSMYGTSATYLFTAICIHSLCTLTARFAGMAPKGNARKQRGRKNNLKGAHTLATRSEDIKRGLPSYRARIDPAKLQRCWLKLRFVFMVYLLHKIALKRRRERQVIDAVRDSENRLPSMYKAKQFGESGHHAFNSADERRLVRAKNDTAEAKEEAKSCRKDMRSLQSQLSRQSKSQALLQDKYNQLKTEKQTLSKAATKQSNAEYKKQWQREHRRQHLVNNVLPELRKAAASVSLTEEQRLQLVVDHITQVHRLPSSHIFSLTLYALVSVGTDCLCVSIAS